jgi:uncharacterized oxidoreductase
MNITQQTVLVTGGATGIGKALARRLLTDGNTVLVCGRRTDALEQAARELPGLITYQCDVANSRQRSALAKRLNEKYPELSVLVNNAGIQRRLDLNAAPFDMSGLAREVEINLIAPIALTQELLPQLRRQTRALIVNISSGLAFCPLADTPVYCATKAAIHSYTLSLRYQLRSTAIRVVELIPPIVETDLDQAQARAEEGPPAISPEVFASEALDRLGAGEDEIAVGLAQGLRQQREAMFSRINP